MPDLEKVLRRERRELRLGQVEALGLLAVIAFIIAVWIRYL